MSNLQTSDYRIRKLIGILGLSLPFMLPIAGNGFLSSISHYYYLTIPSLIFIIILSSFGLFLISYKGYKIDKQTEKLSDDLITNIGGIAALIVVSIPTSCTDSASDSITIACATRDWPLLGHNNILKNTIHLISAGVFIFSMGWMSIFKFTRDGDPNSMENKIYRICGTIVWLAIGFLLLVFAAEKFFLWESPKYIVYSMETLAIVPFGISWLIKGKAIQSIL